MEDALLRNLFQGYQRWVRPIQHANDTIKVRFGLKISQLVDVVRQPTRRSFLLFSTSQLKNTQLKCRLSSFIGKVVFRLSAWTGVSLSEVPLQRQHVELSAVLK